MPFLLNIGLTTNQGERMNARATLRAVEVWLPVMDFATHRYAHAISGVEPTLVLAIDRPLSLCRSTVAQLALTLDQDCIAAWGQCWPITDGLLLGPKADAWGEFDPDKFLILDGRTLSGVEPGERAIDLSARTPVRTLTPTSARIAWPPAAVEADYGA